MPYSDDANSLKIFISYASEDVQIADDLAKTLRSVFFREIEISMMSEFSIGIKWRQIIEDSIMATDIFIAIESGQLKPSHSYTGKEVGMFDISCRLQPKMKNFPELDRLMVPFAVLTRPTEATNEFEGVDIEPDQLYDVRFDPEKLTEEAAEDYTRNDNTKMLKLLRDIDRTINIAKHRGQLDNSEVEERDKTLKSYASALINALLKVMLSRKKFIHHPKTKLTIITPHTAGSSSDPLAASTIKLDGNFEDIFGSGRTDKKSYNWDEFIRNVDIDVSFQWHKALTIVLKQANNIARHKDASAAASSETSLFLDEVCLISLSRHKIFRLATSEIDLYYNNDIEVHVYAVPILRTRDFGDPKTTLLLHAAEIGLGYRFTFLESGAPFSPETFAAENPNKIKTRISDMIDRLTWLMVRSEDYRLSDPTNVLATLGSNNLAQVGENYRKWEDAKNTLYNAAKALLAKENTSFDDQKQTVNVIKQFVNCTQDMNAGYTAEVLKRLHEEIYPDHSAFSSHDVPGLPSATH